MSWLTAADRGGMLRNAANAAVTLRVQRLQHRLGMAFGDAEQGAGGAFGPAVALLPVLQGARADADERRKLALAEGEFFPDGSGVGPVEFGFARGLRFPRRMAPPSLRLVTSAGRVRLSFVFGAHGPNHFPG